MSTRASSARNSAVEQRALVGLLDVLAGVIDQMHVMHAGRTGGHAGEARQAAVDMLDHFARGRPLVLEHVLDQIDAPARAIELVAEQHIGRTGGGAEAAMHAGAQDFFRGVDLRVGELREGEVGLHALHPRPHAAGIEHALGVEAFLHALAERGQGPPPAARTRRARRAPRPARAPAWRGRRAWPTAPRTAAASGSCANGIATQTRPPAQS